MAPEQVRGERVTAACDVFCLGSVLAYASTGRLPFSGADNEVHALLFRIAQEEPDLTGVPVDLADLVRDCLLKDPAARPTTDAILERLVEGEAAEPWLPGALIAQLGRHAVELLDSEDPEESAGAAGPQDAVPPVGNPQPPPAQAPGAVHALPTVIGTQPPRRPRPRCPGSDLRRQDLRRQGSRPPGTAIRSCPPNRTPVRVTATRSSTPASAPHPRTARSTPPSHRVRSPRRRDAARGRPSRSSRSRCSSRSVRAARCTRS